MQDTPCKYRYSSRAIARNISAKRNGGPEMKVFREEFLQAASVSFEEFKLI